jgi:antitoxin MazE
MALVVLRVRLDKGPQYSYLLCRYYRWRLDMRARVQKWGNSLALRVPKAFAAEVGLRNESPVDISVVNGKLVVEPVVEPKLTLEQLLTQVTEDNLHHEVDTGPAVGSEIW